MVTLREKWMNSTSFSVIVVSESSDSCLRIGVDTSTQRDDNDHVDRVSIGNVNFSVSSLFPSCDVGASTAVPSVTVALAIDPGDDQVFKPLVT